MLDILQENWLYLLVGQYPDGALGGIAMTLILALLGVLLSLPIGIIFAVGTVSPIRVVRVVALTVITLFRGMPLLLLIFWAYFLIPSLTGYNVSPFTTMVTALVLYQSAYMAEVVRAGIQGVPSGQMEASEALGFGFCGTMWYFILPQALRAMVPSIISQIVSIVKETSLGYVIGVNELTYVANQVNSTLLTRPFEVFGILAISYFVVCFTLATIARVIDRKFTQKPNASGALAASSVKKIPSMGR